MRILICSNGMPGSESTVRLGGILATASQAETKLLGIAEQPQDEAPLRQALEKQGEDLRGRGVALNLDVRPGEPIRQILDETSAAQYDLVVIGAQGKGPSGMHGRSRKTYEVIKAIPVPVLVALGDCAQLKKFLVCTGGKEFIGEAVQLTGKLASYVGASVTLLHVMAEPPAMYADLMRMEEDIDRLFESKSELGLNLMRQKQDLEKLGASAEVQIRHGLVVDQVFAEVRQGNYDLIVAGTSRARGMIQHFIMGDLTRTILNHARCSVLIARPGKPQRPGFWRLLQNSFAPARP
jgi:nucleotide-binding universal stress UspA family protein